MIQVLVIGLFSFSSTMIFWLKREHDLPDLHWATSQYGLGADPSRFLLQAKWLSEGHGFREVTFDGLLCTSLPPGHPYFLSLVLYVSNNLDILRVVQATFPFFSGLLIFYALRNEIRVQFAASVIIASSPWLTSLSSCHMSETTSTFLVSVMVALISMLPSIKFVPRLSSDGEEYRRGRINLRLPIINAVSNFALGFLGIVSVLTAPGLIFSISAILSWLVVLNRRSFTSLLALSLGFLVPFVAWEYHCYRAEGRVVTSLLTALDKNTFIEKHWVLTWARTPEETILGFNEFAWDVDNDFSKIPERAYRSEKEKAEILSSYNRHTDPNHSESDAEEMVNLRRNLLIQITQDRKKTEPIRYYVILPVQRGVLSWLNQQPIGFLNHESLVYSARLLPWKFASEVRQHGFFRAILRALRGTVGLFALAIHWGTLALFIYCVYKSYCVSPACTILVALSFIAFTYTHGLAGPECRRNIPLLPLAFSLPALAASLLPERKLKATKSQSDVCRLANENLPRP